MYLECSGSRSYLLTLRARSTAGNLCTASLVSFQAKLQYRAQPRKVSALSANNCIPRLCPRCNGEISAVKVGNSWFPRQGEKKGYGANRASIMAKAKLEGENYRQSRIDYGKLN